MSNIIKRAGFHPTDDPVLAAALVAVGCQIQTEGAPGISNVYSKKKKRRDQRKKIIPGKVTVYFQSTTIDGKSKTCDLIQAWVEQGQKLFEEKTQGTEEIELILNMPEADQQPLLHAAQFDGWLPVAAIQTIRRFVKCTTERVTMDRLLKTLHHPGSDQLRAIFYDTAKGQKSSELEQLNRTGEILKSGKYEEARKNWERCWIPTMVYVIRVFVDHLDRIKDYSMDDSRVIPQMHTKSGKSGFKLRSLPASK